jgi:DHA1 family bicyclomycin/chloramphenicol resistance-like MFS transporter
VFFVVLIGALSAAVALVIDSTLPALPAIAGSLGVDAARGQLVLTGLFVGVAGGQMIWGPLSDRYGRRPALVAGLVLAFGAGLACAAATSVGALAALRFAQGLGVSSAPVLARAVVRDLYAHEQAARMLSRVTVVFAMIPIAAPLAGSLLLAWLGWPSIFLMHALFAAVFTAAVITRLAETAPRARAAEPAVGFARACADLLSRRAFLAPTLVQLCGIAGVMAWITNSAFVLIRGFGISPSAYSLMFALVMFGQITGAYTNSRLVARFGIRAMLRFGTRLAAAAGFAGLGLAGAGVAHWAALVLPQTIYMFAFGLIMPNTTAAALTPFPQTAGTASSLMGTLQFAAGAAIGVALGTLYDGTALPLAAVLAGGGLAAALWMLLLPSASPAHTHG